VARLRVRPSDIEFEVQPGESVFEAAERNGYRWPTVCGGVGSCTTCYAVVVEGAGNASDISPFEREGLARIELPPQVDGARVRLACQLTVSGDVTVVRSGVRPRKTS
jgi:ferredoxin, 2Fe-2S